MKRDFFDGLRPFDCFQKFRNKFSIFTNSTENSNCQNNKRRIRGKLFLTILRGHCFNWVREILTLPYKNAFLAYFKDTCVSHQKFKELKKNLRRLRAICQHPDLKNSKFSEKDNSVRLLAELAFILDEISEINNSRKKTRNHRQVKNQIFNPTLKIKFTIFRKWVFKISRSFFVFSNFKKSFEDTKFDQIFHIVL